MRLIPKRLKENEEKTDPQRESRSLGKADRLDRLTWLGIAACMALSGFAALLYQTAWMRQFSIVFGTSELAIVTVLAAYMAGLAGGAAIAARVVERLRRPLFAYGLLEAGIAATALAVPLLLAAATALYTSALGDQPTPPDSTTLGQGLFYVTVGFVVIALPTGFMGATLPFLTRYAVRNDRDVGPDVALLYGINTAGAVAGTITAGFALLPTIGLSATVWVGIGVNLIVFAAAAWLASRAPAPHRFMAAAHAEQKGFYAACLRPLITGLEGNSSRLSVFREQPAWLLPLMLISGANAFLYEVLWTRLLSHVLGGSVYAFATMLATFLAGIALGGALAGRLALERDRSARLFGIAQWAAGALAILTYTALGPLMPAGRSLVALAPYTAAIMFPATLFLGATFPLAVRAFARDEHAASNATARIYAWNTAGAILGTILAGFYLIPTLGFEGSVKLAVAINFALAAAGISLASSLKPRHAALAWLPMLLVVILYNPQRPLAVITSSAITTEAPTSSRELNYAVGRSSTVLLTERESAYELRTNGLPEASIVPRGSPPVQHNQMWLTAIPVAARPEADELLLIGFGGGVAIEAVPESVANIDVIELEPEVIEANRVVSERRAHDPVSDPRVNIIFNDARNALRLTNKRYDIIVSQPSHPWTAGASHLFTREFLEIAREHLDSDGVFVQWMNARFVDAELLRTLAATIAASFSNVRLYQSNDSELLFLGSDGPLDIELFIAATGQPLREHLLHYSYMGLNDVNDFIAALTLDDAGLREFAADAPLSTDNMNYLATRSRSRGDGLDEAGLVELFGSRDPLLDPQSWIYRDFARRLRPAYVASRLLSQGRVTKVRRFAEALPNAASRAVVTAIGSNFDGRSDDAIRAARAALEADPRNPDAQFILISNELGSIAQGTPSPEIAALASQIGGPAAAVIEAWQLAAQQNWQALSERDSALGRSNITDIWYPLAVQLRADWRTKVVSEDNRFALNAMRLLDRALVIYPDMELYVLRAAAANRMSDIDAFVETGHTIASLIESDLDDSSSTRRLDASDLETMLLRLGAFELQLSRSDEPLTSRASYLLDRIADIERTLEIVASERGWSLPAD